MLALRDGRLSLDDPTALGHLDTCTGCGRCESVCPAKVPFTALLDATRVSLRQHQPLPLTLRLLRGLLVRPRLARLVATLARGLRITKRRPSRLRDSHSVAKPSSSRWSAIERRLDAIELPWKGSILGYPRPRLSCAPQERARDETPADKLRGPAHRSSIQSSTQTPGGTRRTTALERESINVPFAVFSGCTAPFAQGDTLRALDRIARAYSTSLRLETAACCGALHAHSGDPETGNAHRKTLTECSKQPCIVLDSGCLAHLEAHRDRHRSTQQRRFISVLDWLETLDLMAPTWLATPVRVALHSPCTERFTLKTATRTRAYLSRLPGVEVIDAPTGPACCGAGGLTGIGEPAQAASLGLQTLVALNRNAHAPTKHSIGSPDAHHGHAAADVIVTTNVGCRLHLQSLRNTGDVTVISLASFIAARLGA